MKQKYYSLKSILATDAQYNIIFGERSTGKTYAVLKYGIEQYANRKGEHMYYKIYIRHEHSTVVIDKYFSNKKEFFAFIGYFYLNSPRKIESIDYEVFDKEKVKNVDFLINRLREYNSD